MIKIPETGFLRVAQIVGNPKAIPPIPPIIPISKSAWWAGVSAGRFPRSMKISERVTVWRVDDIRALIAEIEDRNK